MVADRHRLAAYHNKHCRRAIQGYQHRWPWRTLNAQNRGFSEFFAILGYGVHWASEFSLKLLEINKTTCVRNYTDAVARLMSISSDFLLSPSVGRPVVDNSLFWFPMFSISVPEIFSIKVWSCPQSRRSYRRTWWILGQFLNLSFKKIVGIDLRPLLVWLSKPWPFSTTCKKIWEGSTPKGPKTRNLEQSPRWGHPAL